MVRVSRMRDEVEKSLKQHIRRVYPVVRGLNQWGDLTEKRNNYFRDEFPLVQEPLIEAIPQYQPGEGSTPDDFATNAENHLEKERLEGLGDLLRQAGVNYSLYDHQMKSILAHMRDVDVVVATGTGSGKTESFMFPMMNHLHDEALRCSIEKDGEPSQRAIKCLMLYPMNALVADQLSRLRELLGNPDISTMLMKKGYGRFPQFGMYTGRTDYHGWFALDENEDDDEQEEESWIRNPRTKSISDYVLKLGKLKKREAAWNALIEKYKIPSIGGRIIPVEDGDDATTLEWCDLSVRAQMDLLKQYTRKEEREALKASRFRIDPHEDQFQRFGKSDYPAAGAEANSDLSDSEMAHIGRLGDGLDRELIARYQMHLGGVRQYLTQIYGDDQANHIMKKLGVGIPDVMVTNYSMLEYMLMRPLEHTFWHSTKEWLHGCKREDDDPMRRKLLLVVDEAHLYKGAMGTEFSLLLNRLLNVLEIERNQVQFIITSASLGADQEAKMDYVSGLLSLHGEAHENRRRNIEEQGMPHSKIMDVPNTTELEIIQGYVDGEKETIEEWHTKTSNKLSDREIEDLIRVSLSAREEEKNQQETEHDGLVSLFGEGKIQFLTEYHGKTGLPYESLQQQITYDCISTWPLAYRLKRLLLNPNGESYPLTVEDRQELSESYADIPLDGDADENFPRRYRILKHYLFENPNLENSNHALDLILDLVASARPVVMNKNGEWKDGKSFLPLRMHLLARGDNIPVICPGCGELFSEGTDRCRNEGCAGNGQFKTYTLYIDRNCGGSYLMLWCEANRTEIQGSELKNDPNRYDGRTYRLEADLQGFRRAHQRTSKEADGLAPWFGMLAHPLEENSIDELEEHLLRDVYRLGLRTGRMVQYINRGSEEDFSEQYIHVHLPNKRNWIRRDMVYRETRRMFKPWEMRGSYTHHLQCRYCSRDFTHQDYTNQYSDLQTRGNEFFLGTISTMNSELDPVQASKDYPHQGRKTLIFTDSRQGAARLATKFKTDSSIDEGRSFFTALHHQEWFDALPQKEKSVARIYPYLCIFSGQKRMNFLNDSEDLGRTTMLIHTASLATYFSIKYSDQLDTSELVHKKMREIDFEVERDKYIRRLFIREVSYQRSKILASEIWGGQLELEAKKASAKAYTEKFEEEIMELIDDSERFPIIPLLTDLEDIDARDFLFDQDEWNNLDAIITNDNAPSFDFRSNMVATILKLRQIILDESLMRACLFSDLVLKDTEDGHIKLSKEINDSLIEALSDNRVTQAEFVHGISEWDKKVRPLLGAFSKVPHALGGLILRWASDTLFSLPVLGLGSFKALLSEESRNRLLAVDGIENEHIELFLSVFPWATSNFSPLEGDNESSLERCWLGELFTKTARYRSYGGSLTYSKPMELTQPADLFSDEKLGRWIRDLFGESPHFENMRRISIQITQEERIVRELLRDDAAEGDQRQIFLNANSLLFEPFDDSLNLCSTCFLPKPEALRDATCFTRGCTDNQVVRINQHEGETYFNERLRVWRDSVSRLNNPEQVPRIYRAEEHTAQNSEKLNRDDLFSSTQLYELMFQDIPVTSNKIEGKDGADIEHPPIDILSCSTTMEVGIDIGGLTSVALRNVPPHPANYQQRVGRAGRGSSEVSVALTWVDNTAFATSFFLRPEGLVTSPKKAPKIYVENHVIRTRHLNAVLLQRFFKDENLHPYNPTMLTFREEGGAGASGLLESLGTYEEFIENRIRSFGFEDFDNWCQELIEEIEKIMIGKLSISDASPHFIPLLESMNLNVDEIDSLQYLKSGIEQLLTQLRPNNGDAI